MPVAEASATATEQLHFLPVVGNLAEVFAGFGIKYHGSARHFYHHVVAVLAEAASAGAALAVSGEDMAPVFQRKQRPHIAVAFEYDMASATAVATVGAPFGYIFGTIEMARACASLARTAEDFHIVYKIGFSHKIRS